MRQAPTPRRRLPRIFYPRAPHGDGFENTGDGLGKIPRRCAGGFQDAGKSFYNAPVRTIAVINQKGGVGKTTSVANLGAAVAADGHDICLIDLDPQSHLTLHLGIDEGSIKSSAYDLLTNKAPIVSTIVPVAPHLWVVPSVIDLAAAEVELAATVGREQILRDCLAEADLPFELAMIDCPPSLGLLTLNALAAADDVIIPLQPHFLALHGLGKLLETVSLVQRRINPRLRVSGVILCMYESGTRLASEVTENLRAFFSAARGSAAPWSQARIYETVIRRNIKLAECPSHGKTIFDYEPHSRGAEDYRGLAREFLASLGLSTPPGDESISQPAGGETPPPATAVAAVAAPSAIDAPTPPQPQP
jgi:chromosome partitioning protein